MKLKVLIESVVNFNAMQLRAEIRYPEDVCPNGMFGLDGDVLDVVIDLEPVAKIRGWIGPAIELHAKVCDRCSVWLLDGEKVVASRQDDYVPDFMPGRHYGDYLILEIDERGVITNWDQQADYGEAFATR